MTELKGNDILSLLDVAIENLQLNPSLGVFALSDEVEAYEQLDALIAQV